VNEKLVIEFIIEVLDSDEGISEKAYEFLCRLDNDAVRELLRWVRAGGGGYWLPEDWREKTSLEDLTSSTK